MLNKKFLKLLLFLFILFVFCYFRLKPIYFQTVPFTYDQGRDFLKAQEIIRDKNITFLGPTTGIQGLFHGVWWYYLLVIPFLLFNGNPIGFYYFIFFINLASTIAFFLFINKRFNFTCAITFLSIATASPYLISTSFFPINSILTIPFILLLLFATFEFIKKKRPHYLFLAFLSLGFIFEAEIPFGLFLIPAYIVTIVLTKNVSKFFPNYKYFLSAFLGISIPLLPRLLFEIKNNFLQTKTILSFFTSPSSTNQTSFKGLLIDRLHLFVGYYNSLFGESLEWMAYIIFGVLVIGFFVSLGKKTVIHIYKHFSITLVFAIFVLTLFYKNNFFWGNYLEGFPYFFLNLIVIGIYFVSKSQKKVLRFLPILLLVFYLFYFLLDLKSSLFKKETPPVEGLVVHRKAVEHIYKKNEKNNVCVRIYTPPVIPFTYNYLFSYYSKLYKSPYPSTDGNENTCWYIIEHDDNKERKQKWLADNLPKEGERITAKKFNLNVTVELWLLKK